MQNYETVLNDMQPKCGKLFVPKNKCGLYDIIPAEDFSAENTVKDAIDNLQTDTQGKIDIINGRIRNISNDIDGLEIIIPSSEFSAQNTVKAYIDNEVSEIADLLPASAFDSINTVRGALNGRIRAFETVADMAAATDLTADMICHTNGFHTSGDGGAAFYEIKSSGTANAMDIIACQNSLLAHLVITEPFVTPEQFGAYGDGINDDSTVIQYAIDFSNTNNTKLIVSNEYLLNSQINMKRAISIEGVCSAGVSHESSGTPIAKARFIINHEGIGILIKKDGSYGQVFEGGSIVNVGIAPSETYKSNSNMVGIRIEAWSHFNFKNICFYNFTMGIALSMQNGGQYSNIFECKFDNNLISISEQPKESDTSKFYIGVVVDSCFFDSNGNGTLFSSNPRANSIGIDLYNGANWSIINNRFQGIETCIKGGTGYYTTIIDNRFEMFSYGIKIYGQQNIVGTGNRFDGYLGTNPRTKIAVEIENTAQYTQVYTIGASSLNYIPIRDYGTKTINLFYQHFSVYIPSISSESFIPMGRAKFRGIVQNAKMVTGRIASQDDGFGNSDTKYWNILFKSQKVSGGTYFKTTGHEWGKTNRYDTLTVIGTINDPDNVSSQIQEGDIVTCYMGNVGATETIRDLTIECDLVFWA